MKIYYKIPDKVSDIEGHIDELFKNLDEEYRPVAESIKKVVSDLFNEKLYWQFETLKYKIKWAVRELEKEIDSEDGRIVINDKGGIDIEDFSSDLTDKIIESINERFEK